MTDVLNNLCALNGLSDCVALLLYKLKVHVLYQYKVEALYFQFIKITDLFSNFSK